MMSPRFGLGALSTLLSVFITFMVFLIGTQPVLAAGCVPTNAAFPPGHWVARGISVERTDTDDLSVQVITGTGAFDLTIDQGGLAEGTFSMAGNGFAQSWRAGDDSASTADWLKTGELSGTASKIQIDGELDVHMEGVIDVEPGHDGDQWNASGQDLFAFGNDFTLPFTSTFSPSAANCSMVFGSLGGPVEYGTAQSDQAIFMAYRDGAAPGSVDVQGQLAALIEDARFVLEMDPVDTDVLAEFVLDMLGFESLLASLESCDPAKELDMGPAWSMLQSVMFNTVRVFLSSAEKGAYTTRDVITVIGIWLQGGSLGWRANDCLEPNEFDDTALDLLARFEDILVDRYELARDAGDTAETALIAAAGYQYGLPRVIAAVEAN